MQRRLQVVDGSYIGKFVLIRLEEELKRFHNPNTAKTRKLFQDYLGVENWYRVVQLIFRERIRAARDLATFIE